MAARKGPVDRCVSTRFTGNGYACARAFDAQSWGGGRVAARKGPVDCCVSTVFTGSGDACARAFDAQSGVLQRVFRGHTFVINCLQVRFSLLSSLLPQGSNGPPTGRKL